MSAPVPLNSGCCAPPCPSNPQTAVPGPAGENAFSFTTALFVQPATGANVVVSMTHTGWVVPGQTLFIQGGGFYTVVSVSGLNVTLTNTGNTGNVTPGTNVGAASEVSPGGIGGNIGNAFTVTTANFTQPAVGAQVTVAVLATNWMAVGEPVFVATGGAYRVFSITDGTHASFTNLGGPANAAPATNIVSPQAVTPSGERGATGASGVSTLNGISPTQQKGDIIVDNGANNPLASDVRLGVGANGQLVAADSTQATGLRYATVSPNTVTNDRDIAVFKGVSGIPMSVQDSKMLITSDGAIQSTPTGGNARGTKAVDLQVERAANTQVASATNSTVGGGRNNTASGAQSVVSGGTANVASGQAAGVASGDTNTASAQDSFVGGGTNNVASGVLCAVGAGGGNQATNGSDFIGGGANNIASGNTSFVGAGTTNTASGQYSAVAAGSNNTASGKASSVPGGVGAVANLYAEISHGNIQFAANGDSQANELLWSIATTDATANVEMFLDGILATLRAVVGLNNTWAFHIHLIGRSSAGVGAMWEAKGAIQDVAGTVTLVAGPIVPVVIADGTGGTWGVAASFAVTADNVNKSLKLAVTGAAVTNIRWVAHARLVQVNF